MNMRKISQVLAGLSMPVCSVRPMRSRLRHPTEPVSRPGRPARDPAGRHDFMRNMLDDTRIRHTFKDSNIKRVKDKLVEQFCQLSGGGCVYTGDPMREVHQASS
jgi:hemoglobin